MGINKRYRNKWESSDKWAQSACQWPGCNMSATIERSLKNCPQRGNRDYRALCSVHLAMADSISIIQLNKVDWKPRVTKVLSRA